ncbi:ThiF family adenylyltransferase [Saccharothrix australiensis]|uniref:Molybdopterin/thiamine biosynthesis adenylyltransferase n=1 Tax=Saccharothrix australiensis TaxID=2072 RepID=A0A495W1X1_9PSEU|nr:ThiF family adenylyltransferase [Saccharothrix australiensis]RKT54713.1 molybdopterin/thiamine biosynthesis adenylyltransferase [Saccharothrix australiensis]
MRPSVKISIPRFAGNGAVHFRHAGELLTLEDPDGNVARLLDLLDGSRTVDEIGDAMLAADSSLDRSTVLEAIGELDRSGLLEDGSALDGQFDETELDRFSNNFGFFETYASLNVSKYALQARLVGARVALLGVGGVGSHVLLDLVAMGVEDVRIVDFDRVQLSNLNRQVLYTEDDLGQVKVDLAARRAKALNSACRVDARQLTLSSPDDVHDVVADRDVVLAAVDRPKTTILHWLNAGCARAGVPLVTGGVDTHRVYQYTIVPGVTGCFECWYEQARSASEATRLVAASLERDTAGGRVAGEDTAAFNGLVAVQASMLVCEFVRLATRIQAPVSLGRVMQLTFTDPRLAEHERWERQEGCATCGGLVPREELSWLAGLPAAEPALHP